MASRLNPHIGFRDNAREAMEFYQSVFGGDLQVMPMSDIPGMGEGPEGDLVAHAMLETPAGFTLMAADTPSSMEFEEGSRVVISLSGDDEADLRGHWEKLAEGGQTVMPLEKAPWGDTFGMVVDKYGVSWMVDIHE